MWLASRSGAKTGQEGAARTPAPSPDIHERLHPMTQLRSGRFRRLGTLVAVSTVGALTLAACGGGGDDGDSGDGGTAAADSFTFAFGNAGGTQESPWVVM